MLCLVGCSVPPDPGAFARTDSFAFDFAVAAQLI